MESTSGLTPKWTEADVTINGTHLNFSQSMTLRVALSSFLTDLSQDPYMIANLGEIGPKYIARGREIEKLMLGGKD